MATGDKLVNLEVLKETVQKEVVDLKSAVNHIDGFVESPIVLSPFTKTGYIRDNGTIGAATTSSIFYFPCYVGYKYEIKCTESVILAIGFGPSYNQETQLVAWKKQTASSILLECPSTAEGGFVIAQYPNAQAENVQLIRYQNNIKAVDQLANDNKTSLSNLRSALAEIIPENKYSYSSDWSGTWGNIGNWTTDDKKYRGLVVKKRTNSWSGIYQEVTVEAGKHYHFNAWVKVSDSKQIQIAFVNSTLGSTATVAVESLSPTTAVENISIPARSVAANKWRKINVELIALTSGKIHPLVQLTGSGATIYVCGYSFAEGRCQEKNVYTCTKDGTGDFSKICEAVDWATMYYDSTVYVGAGEWDIIDEFGSTYMGNVHESYNNGNYLKNRIHMIFSSDSQVNAHYTPTGDTTVDNNVELYFSPFNSGIYGFTLENINLDCSNVRYCVHDERQSNSDQYTSRYINCKMKLDNSENTGTTTCQCIGGGLGTNGHIIITGGDYEGINTAHVPSTGYVPISYHNSWGEGKSRIDITGVYIHSGSIRLNWYGPSTEITECYVSGCSFTHAIVSGAETQDTSPNENIEVIAWNNEIRQ